MLQLEIPSDFLMKIKANEPHVKLGEVGDPPGWQTWKKSLGRSMGCEWYMFLHLPNKNQAFMIHGSVNIPGKLHGLFGYGKASTTTKNAEKIGPM